MKIIKPQKKRANKEEYSKKLFLDKKDLNSPLVQEKKIKEEVTEELTTVVAIVPAFNEADRIGTILKTLLHSDIFTEIVVIDDGSSDGTAEVAEQYSSIHVLRNEKNIGKAQSMDRGVKETTSDIIFFCDADLKGLTPKIVKAIIEPVKRGSCDMFIGLRNNIMQQAIHTFAINSGERALRRKLWEELPDFFKYRFRIESGLNCFARKFGRGFGYKTFPYYQILKERKYGFVKGTIHRWQMYYDVFLAYMKIFFMLCKQGVQKNTKTKMFKRYK